jgi:hypothetical protein
MMGDELEEYLKNPTIGGVRDPLAWWSSVDDTPLSRMGRDFMSAPGTFNSSPFLSIFNIQLLISIFM